MRWARTDRLLRGLLLLLIACGGGSIPPSDSIPGASVGNVSMTWSGGITGDVTSVTVDADGRVETTVNNDPPVSAQLAASDLAELHALVVSRDFADLEATYVPSEGICCDRFTYTVAAVVDGVSLESETADGLENPAILTQVIQLLLEAANGG